MNTEVTYCFAIPTYVVRVRIVFDSDLNRETLQGGIQEICDCPTVCNRPLYMHSYTFPATMTSKFEILADGKVICTVNENHKRVVKLPIARTVNTLVIRPIETYGSDNAHIFSFDFSCQDQL